MKKLISLLLAVVLLIGTMALTAYAASTATVTVESTSACPGKEVTLKVTISGNSGFSTGKITLDYDKNALELKKLENGLFNGVTNVDKALVNHASANDVTDNGTLFTATFAIKDSAKGEYTISATVKDMSNLNEDITVTVVNGKLTVGHSFGKYTSNNDATCKENGTETATCACGAKDTRAAENSKVDHKYTTYTSNNDATCTKDGTKTASCDNGCGTKDTVTDSGTKLGHKYTTYTSNNDATCTKDGTKTASCDNGCGTKDTVTDSGTKLEHEWQDATCTSAQRCKNCRATQGQALGHTWVDADCVNPKTCSVCQQTQGSALGHSWDEGVVTKEPTASEPGVMTYTCERCEETRTEDIPYEAPVEPETTITRIYGEGRVETAIAVADMLKDTLNKDSFDAIIISDGNNFADALTGSYLAAVKEAPILLYQENAYELNVEYIQNNLSKNGTVYILGGESAIPADAETSLKNLGFNVIRLQGSTRFETNLAILDEAGVSDQEILICNGWNYADALSASATGLPILLVNTNAGELTAEQTEFLAAHKNNDYIIIGGAAAVSEELEAKIDAQVGDVARVYGETREATSIAVAERFFSEPDMVLVAYSRNFPDGLCGGPLAYALKAPLLLVSPNNETGAAKYINENLIISGHILGGSAVISDELVRSTFDLSADTVILAD